MKKTYHVEKFIANKLGTLMDGPDSQPLLHVVVIAGNITEEQTGQWMAEIDYVENSGQELVPIVISSYGGEVYSFISLHDRIKACSKPVATFVSGKAMSAGALLFSCGTEGMRWIAPNAHLMIHNLQVPMEEGHTDLSTMTVEVREAQKINELCYQLLAKNCGHPPDYFFKLVDSNMNRDVYLTPQEAVKHNLANHIGVPELVLEVKSSLTIKTHKGFSPTPLSTRKSRTSAKGKP